jgi:hypothetical protein
MEKRRLYNWKPGGPIPKIEASVLGRFVEEFRALNDKAPENRDLIEAARPADSPLHDGLCWDEHKNSEEHLKIQARGLFSRLEYIEVEAEFSGVSGEPYKFTADDLKIHPRERAVQRVRHGKRLENHTTEDILGDFNLRASLLERAKHYFEIGLNKFSRVLSSATIGNPISNLQEAIADIQAEIDFLHAQAAAARKRRRQHPEGDEDHPTPPSPSA